MHAGFSRRAPTFPAVARDAARDDVFPVLPAALGDRHDVIEGQLTRRIRLAAVLASMIVARIDVGAGERHVVESSLDPYVAKQPDDRRQLEADRNGPNLPVVHGDNLNLALAPKGDSLLPVDNLEGLIGRVEEKRLFHATTVRSETLVSNVSYVADVIFE